MPTELATLGGGCFWCLEAVFEQLQGVTRVVSGYAGGSTLSPTYEAICTGRTGHAEVVQVTFNPLQVSFATLLDVFFAIHDPTTLNRQGADVGTQYRSVVFYHTPEQAEIARAKIASLSEETGPIVTEVVPLPTFYPAENYHQGYFQSHQRQPYCQMVIGPKLAKFREQFRSVAHQG